MTIDVDIASLIITGTVTAAIGILGFLVFLKNRDGVTNKSFYIFSLITIAYIITNYVAYAVTDPGTGLILFRIAIFFAVWHAFCIFQLLFVFPEAKIALPKWYTFGIVPVTGVVSVLTLTPFVFAKVGAISASGQVTGIVNGPGIIVFGITVFLLIGGGFIFLIRKILKTDPAFRLPLRYVLVGTVSTFVLLITFNFIFPAFLNNSAFVEFGPLSFFPFIILTYYAIARHGLLGVKVISTEILAFALSVVTLMDLVTSTTLAEILLRSGIFVLVLIISMYLIRSVIREVEQREQLAELSRFKSQLLSLASHQMRSPLAAIKGFISLILDGSYGNADQPVKDTLVKMRNSADDLLGLINTLLDVRKVEEGKMEYKFERTELGALVAGVVEGLRPLAVQKKLEFTYTGPGREVFVNADPEKFKQVIQNLTDNAIKYTPSGFVKVALESRAGKAIVTVSDSGLGISKELIPYLFEEFIRDERVKKSIRGTGLGLYIARKIIEAHGGTIAASSDGEGKGSTFTMTIAEAPQTISPAPGSAVAAPPVPPPSSSVTNAK